MFIVKNLYMNLKIIDGFLTLKDSVCLAHGSKKPWKSRWITLTSLKNLDSFSQLMLSPRVLCLCKQRQRMRIVMREINMADGLPLAIDEESYVFFEGTPVVFPLQSSFTLWNLDVDSFVLESALF